MPTVYVASAGYHSNAYAHVGEYELVGRMADLVGIKRMDGSTDTVPAVNVFDTREEATARCVEILRGRREAFTSDIDGLIAKLTSSGVA